MILNLKNDRIIVENNDINLKKSATFFCQEKLTKYENFYSSFINYLQ